MAGSDDESKLIEHSLSGDPEAYAALVNQHQRMIRAVTFRMTGSLDDSEELAQDAFLRAYQQLESFNGDSKFSTWLCKIAINLSLDWRRRESRRDDIHSKWATEVTSQDGRSARFPDELSQRVQSALNRLTGLRISVPQPPARNGMPSKPSYGLNNWNRRQNSINPGLNFGQRICIWIVILIRNGMA